MVGSVERQSARRWVLPVLVLFLVLGHACELPAYADVVGSSHTGGESHHADDGHSGDQALSCDPAVATSSPSHPQLAAGPEISVVSQVDDPAPARVIAVPFEGAKSSGRPPLFLLYASLLI